MTAVRDSKESTSVRPEICACIIDVGGLDEFRAKGDRQGGVLYSLPAHRSFFNVKHGQASRSWLPLQLQVYLDRHGMVSFHKKVLNSQFFWWSLVPVLGCATAAMRWKAMSESKRKYDSWAHASHMALTQHSVIVVGIPTEEHRGQLPAQVCVLSAETAPHPVRLVITAVGRVLLLLMQAWPRESISLESILDIHVDTRPSRVCCVRNTVKTVRLKLSAHSTPMQLVGILDPKQFIEDVFAIQSGASSRCFLVCFSCSHAN